MGLLRWMKTRRCLNGAMDLFDRGREAQAFEAIEAEQEALGPGLWTAFGQRLFDRDHLEPARRACDHALAARPADGPTARLAARIALGLDDDEASIAALRRLISVEPKDLLVAQQLGELLLERGDREGFVEAMAPYARSGETWFLANLGTAYFELDDNERAVELLEEAMGNLDVQMRHAIEPEAWKSAKERLDALRPMYDEAAAILWGAEELINLSAGRAQLDAHAGVNYRLLGARLMVDQPAPLTEQLELIDAETMERDGKCLIAEDRRDVRGLYTLGCAMLRTGRAEKAEALFKRACEADGACFAAFLGLGAAMDVQQLRSYDGASALPALERPPGIEDVVPDWPALTDLERRVVVASVWGLRFALDRLASRGATIRVLPLDVRSTDLEPLSEASGVRTDDHRDVTAITGLASDRIALSKVEDLLDVDGEHGWVFAHELAHLVLLNFEEELLDLVAEMHDRAAQVGFLVDGYQDKNDDEFFAIAYTDSLRHRFGRTEHKHLDEEGVLEGIYRAFERLAELDDLEGGRLRDVVDGYLAGSPGGRPSSS